MKKIISLVSINVILSLSVFSQAFNTNDNVVNVGVGLFNPYFFGNDAISLPAISASFEHGTIPIGKKIGVISFGAYAGAQYAWRTIAGYTDTWTTMTIGARGIYHFTMLKIENTDIYAGAFAGARLGPHTWYENTIFTNGPVKHTDFNADPISDVFAGIRYYFRNNISVFAEAGYGITFLTGGISARL